MCNSEAESNRLIGRTCRNDLDSSISLDIPKEFAEQLKIGNSKVSMSLLNDFDGNKHLVVTKYYNEIVID